MTDWTPFELDALLAGQHASGEAWLEYFRVPSLRAGRYVLAPGAWDHQTPPEEDEFYYVVSGRASFEGGRPAGGRFAPATEATELSNSEATEATETMELSASEAAKACDSD